MGFNIYRYTSQELPRTTHHGRPKAYLGNGNSYIWSWNKNQNVVHKQIKTATMVLNMLLYIYLACYYGNNI